MLVMLVRLDEPFQRASGPAGVNDASLVQHDGAIHERCHRTQPVGNEQDRGSTGPEGSKHLGEALLVRQIHRGHGFVQNEHVRLACEGARYQHALLLPSGKRHHGFPFAWKEIHRFEGSARRGAVALGERAAEGPPRGATRQDHLGDGRGNAGRGGNPLRDVADAVPSPETTQLLAEQSYLSPAEADESQQRLHERRLAGAVVAEQDDELSGVDPHRDLVQHRTPAHANAGSREREGGVIGSAGRAHGTTVRLDDNDCQNRPPVPDTSGWVPCTASATGATHLPEEDALATDATDLHPITMDEARDLARWTAVPTISIFLPTERAIADPDQNSLVLKGLIPPVVQQLEQRQVSRRDIEMLVEPINRLLGDRHFWFHQLGGLALFRTKDEFRRYPVPVSLPQRVYVGDTPVLRPLLKALSSHTEFHVLALSKNAVRLFHCSRHNVREIDLTSLDIPLNFDEAMRYDDFEKPSIQHRPMSGKPRPARNTSQGADFGFHGHGGDEDHKRQILRYLQMIDPGISKLLEAEGTPLILAGVDYIQPIFKQASSYPKIVERGIEGNADGLRPEELHQRAVPIFEEEVARSHASLMERIGDLSAHGRASFLLADVLDGAFNGRIDQLFLAEDAEMWGTYDPADRVLNLDEGEDASPASVELYDLAARQTILTSGMVNIMEPGKVPGGGDVAALFRY